MSIRQGVQSEVLLSLATIMFTATALLLVIFLETNRARIDALHPILARGFLVDSRSLPLEFRGIESADWWHVDSRGRTSSLSSHEEPLDDLTRALGQQALKAGSAHVRSGAPWAPIVLASPDPLGDGVLLARIAAPISGWALGALIVVDILVFGFFGFSLLRRRVVGPLRRLAEGVREIADNHGDAPILVEGSGEIAAVATAFNEMQTALAARTGSLEKAVEDLRDANLRVVAAREGLDRAERLAMVGSMAAGVAHEVGNPMGAMLAFLDVAGRDEGLGEEGKRCLKRASEQGERVRIILRQLLDFSRPPQVQRVAISMADVAEQVVELVSAQHEYAGINFEVLVEEGVSSAQGDRSLASQILLNLVLNAGFALEGQENPRIRVHVTTGAARGRCDDEGQEWTQRRSADTILCIVEDSGNGVDSGDAERIFDPFFTTKEPGKGTGLGLANALRLAQEMGGFVRLDTESSPLGGAIFVFALCATPNGKATHENVRGITADQSRIP